MTTQEMQQEISKMSDHDVLIKIHTQVERVITDVAELNNNFAAKIRDLENNKLDRSELMEMKGDFKWLQRIAYTGIGISLAVQFYFNFIR